MKGIKVLISALEFQRLFLYGSDLVGYYKLYFLVLFTFRNRQWRYYVLILNQAVFFLQSHPMSILHMLYFSLDELLVSSLDQQKLQSVLSSVTTKSDVSSLLQEIKAQAEVSLDVQLHTWVYISECVSVYTPPTPNPLKSCWKAAC